RYQRRRCGARQAALLPRCGCELWMTLEEPRAHRLTHRLELTGEEMICAGDEHKFRLLPVLIRQTGDERFQFLRRAIGVAVALHEELRLRTIPQVSEV